MRAEYREGDFIEPAAGSSSQRDNHREKTYNGQLDCACLCWDLQGCLFMPTTLLSENRKVYFRGREGGERRGRRKERD